MLLKDPLRRLAKFAQIKNHPYFAKMKFEDLLVFNINPPYFPDLTKINENNNVKPITYAHYMKGGLTEYKLPADFKPSKKQIIENTDWYKNF